jgi:DNA invertase Pin-like site-specific DNA recombinase
MFSNGLCQRGSYFFTRTFTKAKQNDERKSTMPASKKAVIYARVSTDSQTTENQTRELQTYATRMGYQISATLTDNGISGSKKDRPAFARLSEMICRKEIDIVLAWSVDRISRSLPDLLTFLGELKSKNVDLFLHQNNLDTSTSSGRAMFQLLGVFSELEREICRERIMSGLARARAAGKRLGRPSVADSPQVIASVKLLRQNGHSIHKIARDLGIGVGTTQKILKAA